MSSQNLNASVGVVGAIDPTDVPVVAVRELATALKVLSHEAAALVRASEWSEDDLRRVEQYFWQRCGRDRGRKVAALVRMRSLIQVCRARTLQALIAQHGTAAVLAIVSVAASMRLNTSVGFSPNKICMAALAALRDGTAAAFDPLSEAAA